MRSGRARGRAALVALLVLGGGAGAWWSGSVPCALVVAQPACQLVVTGGPVLDTADLVDVRSDDGRVAVREPAGRLLATTIEVSEPDGVAGWWAALRDADVDLVARSRLVPPGGDLDDVARTGRVRMEESRTRAAGLALAGLGLVPDAAAGEDAWPVTVTFSTDEVGGPSAGLMLALAVHARLAPTDPTARVAGAASALAPLVVAGTGALDVDGSVGAVCGVDHKLRSVVDHVRGGRVPDAFLLPTADLPLARRTVLERDVLLVPVDDLADAVASLAVLAAGDMPADAVALGTGAGGGR